MWCEDHQMALQQDWSRAILCRIMGAVDSLPKTIMFWSYAHPAIRIFTEIENGIWAYRGMPGKVTYFSHIGSACTLHPLLIPPPTSHWFLGKRFTVFYSNTEEGARMALSSGSEPLHLYKLMGVVMQKYVQLLKSFMKSHCFKSYLMPAPE